MAYVYDTFDGHKELFGIQEREVILDLVADTFEILKQTKGGAIDGPLTDAYPHVEEILLKRFAALAGRTTVPYKKCKEWISEILHEILKSIAAVHKEHSGLFSEKTMLEAGGEECVLTISLPQEKK